jgi:predicted alpha/beta hydrolase family esterase
MMVMNTVQLCLRIPSNLNERLTTFMATTGMSKTEQGLIEISGCENSSRDGDVIFVHGLMGHARGTWHPQERHDDNNFWPAWLGKELPNVGIWSLGYEVEPFKWKGNAMSLVDRATNTLALLDSYDIGERPLIFIVHSLGGLLIKQMLRHAQDLGTPRWQAIVEQTRGIVFLSTPHSGSDIASWIKHISGIVQTTVSVDELEVHHSRLRELNLLYRNHERLKQIPMEVYCETRTTKGILVVNQTSADPGIAGVIPIPMDYDHISICKPESKNSPIYRRVKRFIQEHLTTPLPTIPAT